MIFKCKTDPSLQLFIKIKTPEGIMYGSIQSNKYKQKKFVFFFYA